MNVTIRDIAKMANVSIATVSRYINNPEAVSEKKRLQIAEIIEKVNYRPNEVARGLSNGTSKIIGILLPAVNNIFFSTVILGIEDELSKKAYTALVCNTHEKIEREKQYMDILISRQVAGLIFMGTRQIEKKSNEHIWKMNDRLPLIIVNDYFKDEQISYIMTDESDGVYKAVQYLYELGHRKIYFFNGNKKQTTYQYKLEGFMRGAKERKLEEAVKVLKNDPFESGGYKTMMKLIHEGDIPTGIIVASDQMAMGVVRAIHESGLSIPKNISVIGFDNSPISGEVYPRLTTVDQKPYELGKEAGRLLMKQIESKNKIRSSVLQKPELLVRDSTGKAT